ncbi:S-adenosyl-L-methionine-dependent methyltransferase, partial [Choiromyces venosus 120613-1]
SSNNAFVEYFNNVATRYESDTGGCTRAIGRHSLSLALPTIDESSVILDNACGPGQLTDEIISAVTYPMKIHAADASTKMIELVQDKIDKNNYTNVQAAVMDGNKLDFPDEYFTHSFTIHGIFFFPDNGAKELRRTLKKGGKAYVTTWSHQGLLPVFRAVQKCIRPHDPPYSNEMFETWNKEETLVNCLEKAGFTDIKIDRGFRAYIRQDNIEGLMRSWDFMKGGVMQGWTDEEK